MSEKGFFPIATMACHTQHGPGKTKSRVGIILFLAIDICLFLLCVVTFHDLSTTVKSQRRIFVCVLLALPPVAVRLLYSLFGVLVNNNRFSIINGSATIQLAMATIEEFLVVLMFAILGVLTPRSEPAPATTYDEQYCQNDCGCVQNTHY